MLWTKRAYHAEGVSSTHKAKISGNQDIKSLRDLRVDFVSYSCYNLVEISSRSSCYSLLDFRVTFVLTISTRSAIIFI